MGRGGMGWEDTVGGDTVGGDTVGGDTVPRQRLGIPGRDQRLFVIPAQAGRSTTDHRPREVTGGCTGRRVGSRRADHRARMAQPRWLPRRAAPRHRCGGVAPATRSSTA